MNNVLKIREIPKNNLNDNKIQNKTEMCTN